jgi:hypothetical protein
MEFTEIRIFPTTIEMLDAMEDLALMDICQGDDICELI